MKIFQDHLNGCISQGFPEKQNQQGICLSSYLSIMKNWVTQLQSGKFKIRNANIPVLVKGQPETPREPGRANVLIQRQWGRWNKKDTLLFSSSLQLIKWGSLTLWKAICFFQAHWLNINVIQKHPWGNNRKNFANYLGTPWPHQVDM